MNKPPVTIPVLDVPIMVASREAALDRIDELLEQPGTETLAFVNAHALTLASRDPSFRRALTSAGLVLNDGVGVALAARLSGARFPANLNGTDLLPDVLARLAASHRTVFFYGGLPGVAGRTARHWAALMPGLQVVGHLDGYSLSGAAAAEVIRRSGADAVLVALGNPRQELWAHRYGARTSASLVVSVGAFFDFSIGEVRRAPLVLRSHGLEWAYRLAHEPRRLAGRYVVGIPVFVLRVIVAELRSQLAQPTGAQPTGARTTAHAQPTGERTTAHAQPMGERTAGTPTAGNSAPAEPAATPLTISDWVARDAQPPRVLAPLSESPSESRSESLPGLLPESLAESRPGTLPTPAAEYGGWWA